MIGHDYALEYGTNRVEIHIDGLSRRERVLVILDSNHSKGHVLAELEAYASFVTPGSYIVATDGIMESLADVPRTATYTRAYDTKPGFMTLVSDGEKLIGAYAVGPEAGEWLGQATLAIRAEVPLAVLRDTIQPFPTFSEIYVQALDDLCGAAGQCLTAAQSRAPARA